MQAREVELAEAEGGSGGEPERPLHDSRDKEEMRGIRGGLGPGQGGSGEGLPGHGRGDRPDAVALQHRAFVPVVQVMEHLNVGGRGYTSLSVGPSNSRGAEGERLKKLRNGERASNLESTVPYPTAEAVSAFSNQHVSRVVDYFQLATMEGLQTRELQDESSEAGGPGGTLANNVVSHHVVGEIEHFMVPEAGASHRFLSQDFNEGMEFLPVGGFPGGLGIPGAHPRFSIPGFWPVIEDTGTASAGPASISKMQGEDLGIGRLRLAGEAALQAGKPPI